MNFRALAAGGIGFITGYVVTNILGPNIASLAVSLLITFALSNALFNNGNENGK